MIDYELISGFLIVGIVFMCFGIIVFAMKIYGTIVNWIEIEQLENKYYKVCEELEILEIEKSALENLLIKKEDKEHE